MRQRRISIALVVFTFLWSLSTASFAQDSGQVTYVVETDLLSNHKVKVTASFPPGAFPGPERLLALPVWTPGSYKVRDYSRFLSTLEVLHQGATVQKTAKNRWLISGVPQEQAVQVSYEVYGHELTVRTNYFTPELGLMVGAATFLAPAPLNSETMAELSYRVDLRQSKVPVSCALPSPQDKVFVASSYDELVDSPILLGDITSHDFVVGGLPHQLVQAGDRRYWDLEKSLKDTAQLVKTIQEFWGTLPYERYLFMNLITDTRGGLEHKNSTVVMTSRFATEKRKDYLGWLSLLSHEFFHTWNVKRLRPASLGPFDYETEVYTRSLWIAEGITSYYDDLLVRRAGLSTRAEYLEALSGQLNSLKLTPGRRQISLSDASFDAWIRLYQPTDDLHNSNISYYNKGAVVAWLLDTEIRKRSAGKKSLDHLMRAAYEQFSEKGFEESEFRALASKVAGVDLEDFFERTLDSKDDLFLEEALQYWHLEWTAKSDEVDPYLGLELEASSRVVVSKVFANSPAAKAGIAPGDEILAIDGVRLPQDSPLSVLKHLKTETSYPVLIARLGVISSKDVKLASPDHQESELSFKESQRTSAARWKSWLGPESPESESKT